jgi:hypothetical protein
MCLNSDIASNVLRSRAIHMLTFALNAIRFDVASIRNYIEIGQGEQGASH